MINQSADQSKHVIESLMERTTRELKKLEVPIANKIKQICLEYMGSEPGEVECTFLRSHDLVITIKRQRSATEIFLEKQGRQALSKEIGVSVNQAFRERVALVLMKEFDLPVNEISMLKPVSPSRFSLMVLISKV